MATFSGWWTAWQKKPEPRQLTWLGGTEEVLKDDVVDSIKAAINPEPWNFAVFSAGDDSERSIWAEAEQYTMGRDTDRLLVIRNAEKLKDTDRLLAWVKNRTRNPRTYLVLVSNEEKIPRTEPTDVERKAGIKSEIVPHLAAFSGGKGYVVECRAFTNDTARHAIDWVRTKTLITKENAAYLLTRANGDLRLVRDVCRKLSMFEDFAPISAINGLLGEQPRDSFPDALLQLDRKGALLALQSVPTSEYSAMVGLLDARLDLAGQVHDMMLEHRTPSEMARALGKQGFLVKDVMPVAQHYNSSRRLAIRQLLAQVDSAVRRGVTSGPLEAVVAFW